MKKIIYITLIVLSFLLFNNKASAITFGQDRFTDVYIKKVMPGKVGNVYGGKIYVKDTNEIAYCIEPFGSLTNKGTYYD